MTTLTNPFINSQEIAYEAKINEERVHLVDISKPLIEIWGGGNEDPYESIELDRSTRKYMHATLKQIINTYDEDGKENTQINKFPVQICSEKFFITEYEKKFYKRYKDDKLHCSEDPSVYLQGTRDSRVAEKEHSYLIYEF